MKLRKEKVKYHKITLHKVLEQNEFLIKQPKNYFKCKRCQERFRSKNVLRNHKATCQSKIIDCKVCTKIFSKNNELEAHIKSEHKEIKKFDCEKCEITFGV